MNIQEKILFLRGRGLTQSQICAFTGISQSSVSKIENGEQSDVTYRKGIALDILVSSEQTKNQSDSKLIA
ncbi:helix-turn-helix domain-containing protein [Acinetobacter larvae]|uniref:Transcriptional regulator n=1 Tax=Acinetobacter larvae TaxID=1789224 RepID=A0A1B2LZG1_9GAMM|nr:helix-turn-helix transcriptional regulator [Acinetobacter larvae]AOA58301.1 transcriptional regulator [Acinetobacter larvae]